MKITKSQLKKMIQEELEMGVGADIDQYAGQVDAEEISPSSELLGTPEGTLLALMHARKTLDKYGSFRELAADLGIEATREMARLVSAIKANPMYASSKE